MKLETKFKASLVLNTSFAIFELITGIISGSLALVSDAGHNLTDSLSLVVSFTAQKISKRRATHEHTYGYGKITIIAAFINSLILIFAALYIFYQAYQRILHPQGVEGSWVMIVASFGILVNGAVALIFYKDRSDLNVRSAYLNMANDVIASIGALVAGGIIYFTGKTIVDPFISIIIGAMLLFSSWEILNKALHVLLEGVPEEINLGDIQAQILSHPDVLSLHDLHVWTISSKATALVCHMVPKVFDTEKNLQIVKEIKQNLQDKFKINHSTIEVETTACPPHEH